MVDPPWHMPAPASAPDNREERIGQLAAHETETSDQKRVAERVEIPE